MVRSPWQNPLVERFFRTVRRELLDHVIPFNERDLLRLLSEYVEFYNKERPHQSIDGSPPRPTESRHTKSPPTNAHDDLVAYPVCGGLHHVYRRKAT
jgi:transposase InsO family protein